MLGLVAANSVEVFHPMMDDWECTRSCSNAAGWHWDNTPRTEVWRAGWPHRYNDVDNGNAPYPTLATDGIQIARLIQTLQHSFFVQSYAAGNPQGKLYVRGSIAQEWRGVVGTQGGSPMCGYVKDYHYDKRLRFASPPYFPQWARPNGLAATRARSARSTGEPVRGGVGGRVRCWGRQQAVHSDGSQPGNGAVPCWVH